MKTTNQNIAVNFKNMKPYFIYWFDTELGKPSFESGYQAYIEQANSECDALKQWHIHLNGYYSSGNSLRNRTYHAVCAL